MRFSEQKLPISRLMVFIDGGYLRETFKKRYGSDVIDYPKLKDNLLQAFNATCNGLYQGDLVRTYFYDAMVPIDHPDYSKLNEYHKEVRRYGFEVITTRLKQAGEVGITSNLQKSGGMKQKGTDVKLAVDMITKAYLNHYDFAILLTGDDDFLDVVKAVKDTGKRVLGIFFSDHISPDLADSYDVAYAIENFVENIR